MKLTKYPGTVRQLVVTGLGHATPTVIITNEADKPVKALIEPYARRMTIEQRLTEIICAFCLDALSSAVPRDQRWTAARLAGHVDRMAAASRRQPPGSATWCWPGTCRALPT